MESESRVHCKISLGWYGDILYRGGSADTLYKFGVWSKRPNHIISCVRTPIFIWMSFSQFWFSWEFTKQLLIKTIQRIYQKMTTRFYEMQVMNIPFVNLILFKASLSGLFLLRPLYKYYEFFSDQILDVSTE